MIQRHCLPCYVGTGLIWWWWSVLYGALQEACIKLEYSTCRIRKECSVKLWKQIVICLKRLNNTLPKKAVLHVLTTFCDKRKLLLQCQETTSKLLRKGAERQFQTIQNKLQIFVFLRERHQLSTADI